MDSCFAHGVFDDRIGDLHRGSDALERKGMLVGQAMEEWMDAEQEGADEDTHAWVGRLPTLNIAANEVTVDHPNAELGRGSFAIVWRATWRCTTGKLLRTSAAGTTLASATKRRFQQAPAVRSLSPLRSLHRN